MFEQDTELPFNEYSEMVEGYVDSVLVAESVAWLAEVLDGRGLKNEEYQEVRRKQHQPKLRGIEYTKELPEHAPDSNRLMAEIATETFHWADSD